MSPGVHRIEAGAADGRAVGRLHAAARWATVGAGVLALATGAVLWASEGARVFAEAAFAAALACL